ncbi:hypothetical protein ZWY2020_010804 [Hordeum vulgare]|nr:hypothetical protein ZWY2020_010804 [Hordeum vulgare]
MAGPCHPASPGSASDSGEAAQPSAPSASLVARVSPADLLTDDPAFSVSPPSASPNPKPLSGHPALRPAGAVCYLPYTAEMRDAELALRRALEVIVLGNRTRVTESNVPKAIVSRHGLDARDFSVHRRPEDFLVRFHDESIRSSVAAENVRTPKFRLRFSPWSNLAGAELVTVRIRVYERSTEAKWGVYLTCLFMMTSCI